VLHAEAILRLKPGRSLDEDIEAWAFEKNGCYSVRSCYRMLKHESDQKEDFDRSETSSTGSKRWWSYVWKLKVPPKIRIFWWRVLNNFLPSKSELKRRHVAREDHCDACGLTGESQYPIMVSCPLAIRFWREIKVITGCKLPLLHPESWATDLLTEGFCTPQEAAVFVCGAWSLWTARNGRKHGRTSWSPVAAAKHVSKMIEDLICLTHKPPAMIPRRRGVWKKPEAGWKMLDN
jgi:hypothetical protein